MALVSSIRHHAITNDYNDGARALKNYLRYAEAVSAGDLAAAHRVLREINSAVDAIRPVLAEDAVIPALTLALRERGYHVDIDIGQSGFRCDLAVRAGTERMYRLGILVDTETYYANNNFLERDVLRPRLLRAFGWDVMLVLTKEWYENPATVVQAIEKRLTRR